MKNSKLIIYYFILILCAITNNVYPKNINLEVDFPANYDFSKLSIFYNNGFSDKKVIPTINNNKWIFSDSTSQRYGKISFYYWGSNDRVSVPGYIFWISDLPAKIDLSKGLLPNENPFKGCELHNALSWNNLYEEKVTNEIKLLDSETNNYLRQNQDSFRVLPIKKLIFRNYLDSLVNKNLQLIKSHSNDYFFLDYFQNSVVSVQYSLSTIDLLNFYNSVFPDSLKQTFKGKQIETTLKSKISSSEGSEAPNFKLLDIEGKVYSLRGLRGKYIMLEFWASWCAPCIKLAPTIKELRDLYPIDKLAILSITLDNKYTQFSNALNQLHPNTTQIFEGEAVVEDYAVGPIPQIILIDKNGRIIYNKQEEKDYDLLKLKLILNNQINSIQ